MFPIIYAAEIVFLRICEDGKKEIDSHIITFMSRDEALRYVDDFKDTDNVKLKFGKVWEFQPVIDDEVTLRRRAQA